jgi:hypothetical protein
MFVSETAAGAFLYDSVWRWVSLHVLVADVGGVIELRINGATVLTVAGDTYPGGYSSAPIVMLRLYYHSYYDDFVWNSPFYVLNYDGGATPGNVPTVGYTVADGTGKTAVVRNYSGDGTSGFLVVDTVVGVWVDGDPISDAGAGGVFAATTCGGVITDNVSWQDTPVFIKLASASADGTTITWTPSAGSNYQCISELPPAAFPDTTTYVTTTVSGNSDTYAVTNAPADAGPIRDVRVFAYARRDGTGIQRTRTLVRSGGTTYDSAGTVSGTSWLWRSAAVPIDPATGVGWVVAGLNDAEFGVKAG